MNRELLRLIIATAGGAGLIRFAPGTWGAAVGVIPYLCCAWLPEPWQTGILLLFLALSCAGTVWIGPWAERRFGKKDPGAVVIDEVAGILFVLLCFRVMSSCWTTLCLVFPLTRLFDIVKPPPARRLEKLPQGWGVLADDLMSAVYTVIVLWLLRFWQPGWFS